MAGLGSILGQPDGITQLIIPLIELSPDEVPRHARKKKKEEDSLESKKSPLPGKVRSQKPRSRPLKDEQPRIRKVRPIKKDETGQPIMPLTLGVIKVLSLGKVVWEHDGYHTMRYIFPVGYEATRAYASMNSSDQQAVYHCRIVDGGELGPVVGAGCHRQRNI